MSLGVERENINEILIEKLQAAWQKIQELEKNVKQQDEKVQQMKEDIFKREYQFREEINQKFSRVETALRQLDSEIKEFKKTQQMLKEENDELKQENSIPFESFNKLEKESDNLGKQIAYLIQEIRSFFESRKNNFLSHWGSFFSAAESSQDNHEDNTKLLISQNKR